CVRGVRGLGWSGYYPYWYFDLW
nr:immunoglobulin heavy chain junction region [Macaca mulatta]MOV40811.1 immunoglobulin heavy chain junction region [Macaca mulatta]MOV43235.1 immunoglobulin heavy chain junction region [Macaca mulatta]MOV45787.1 immunoglobulin heavy chain junction region [Macaca mulatta]